MKYTINATESQFMLSLKKGTQVHKQNQHPSSKRDFFYK